MNIYLKKIFSVKSFTSHQTVLSHVQKVHEIAGNLRHVQKSVVKRITLLSYPKELCICFDYINVDRAEYDLFQIELSKSYGLTEWKEDVKKLLMKAGVENMQMVFLFVDTQASLGYISY